MGFQIFGKKTEPVTAEGLYIPASDLVASGLSLDDDFSETVTPELQRDRLLLATVDSLTAYLSDLPPELRLGLSATRPNFQSLNWKFEVSFQGFTAFDHPGGIKPLPIPTTGKNSGKGEVSLAEIWPNVKKLAASVPSPGPGLLIPTADLKPYWGGSHSDLSPSGDGRAVLWAIFRWLASPDGATVRGKGEKSAVTGKTHSPGVATRPAVLLGKEPITGFNPIQMQLATLLTFSASLAFSLKLSRQSGRSWDVNCSL